jgi:hypothetical protein
VLSHWPALQVSAVQGLPSLQSLLALQQSSIDVATHWLF